jgi:hypothetical protein
MRNMKSKLAKALCLAAALAGGLAINLPAAAQSGYVYSPVALGGGSTARLANRFQPIIYSPVVSGGSTAVTTPRSSGIIYSPMFSGGGMVTAPASGSSINYSPATLGGSTAQVRPLRPGLLKDPKRVGSNCFSDAGSAAAAADECGSLLQCTPPKVPKCSPTTPGQAYKWGCRCQKPTPGAFEVGYLGGGF